MKTFFKFNVHRIILFVILFMTTSFILFAFFHRDVTSLSCDLPWNETGYFFPIIIIASLICGFVISYWMIKNTPPLKLFAYLLILGILVVCFLSIFYFGLLSPKNYSPSPFSVGYGFRVCDFKASADTFEFTLINRIGKDLTSIEINFFADVANDRCDLTAGELWTPIADCSPESCKTTYVGKSPIKNNKRLGTFRFTGCENFQGAASGGFTITYVMKGDTQSHQITGKGNLKVQN
ncbi:MAG: hypothetical protein ABIJ21_01965 [Nanoarchaeota archaeon]